MYWSCNSSRDSTYYCKTHSHSEYTQGGHKKWLTNKLLVILWASQLTLHLLMHWGPGLNFQSHRSLSTKHFSVMYSVLSNLHVFLKLVHAHASKFWSVCVVFKVIYLITKREVFFKNRLADVYVLKMSDCSPLLGDCQACSLAFVDLFHDVLSWNKKEKRMVS